MMRSSPGYGCSRPPLRKYVTCGYFSVSAMRSWVRPAAAAISPKTFGKVCGGKIVCRNPSRLSLDCAIAAVGECMHAGWNAGLRQDAGERHAMVLMRMHPTRRGQAQEMADSAGLLQTLDQVA